MALSEDTKWTIGIGAGLGVGLLTAIGWAVLHLTDLQTRMETRLSENITAAESRLTERINQVDGRLDKVDSRLGAVEQKAAVLAGIEDRLSQQVATAENRLAEDIRNVEDRLIGHIDKLDGRLGAVEQRTTTLAGIVRSRWTPSRVIWPKDEESIAKVALGQENMDFVSYQGQGKFDPKTLERMKELGLQTEYFLTPVPYVSLGGGNVTIQQVIEAIQGAGQAAEDAKDPILPAPTLGAESE